MVFDIKCFGAFCFIIDLELHEKEYEMPSIELKSTPFSISNLIMSTAFPSEA